MGKAAPGPAGRCLRRRYRLVGYDAADEALASPVSNGRRDPIRPRLETYVAIMQSLATAASVPESLQKSGRRTASLPFVAASSCTHSLLRKSVFI